jgi:hypothetical protein
MLESVLDSVLHKNEVQMSNVPVKPKSSLRSNEVLQSIAQDRIRTNLLNKYEQRAIAFLVMRVPSQISSDMLTFIGFFGSVIVFLSFILAAVLQNNFLLFGILGLAINWFGDALDGRIAFYRNKPRKWYGFALDITADWLSIIIIGSGFVFYIKGIWGLLGYFLVAMYGWSIIISLMEYKVTGKHSIDSGKLGPTEGRIIFSAILTFEVFIKNSILYSSAIVCTMLFFINIFNTLILLRLANEHDINEKKIEYKNGDD